MQLGAKEATDKAHALMDQLRAKWAEARRQFEESISTASRVADTVRTGLERPTTTCVRRLLNPWASWHQRTTRSDLHRPAAVTDNGGVAMRPEGETAHVFRGDRR